MTPPIVAIGRAGQAALVILTVLAALPARAADEAAVTLPNGVHAVWDTSRAFQEATPTRERICINGLWRWQPAEGAGRGKPPGDGWGYFKVPGAWPGITDYMQKDFQTVYRHPRWQSTPLAGVSAAWYERAFRAPAGWTGRRILLDADNVNSVATVFVDGAEVGVLRFPGGAVDLTAAIRPGTTQTIALHVAALPLKEVMLSFGDTSNARTVRGSVARRGLCGDVYLVSTPPGARVDHVRVATALGPGRITFDTNLAGLDDSVRYELRAAVSDRGRALTTFTSQPFRAADLAAGRFSFTADWTPERLWDLHTPENTYAITLSLRDDHGAVLDTAWTEQVGFRDFHIVGRDFWLNGSRVFLSAVPLDNAQVGGPLVTYAGARESLARLKAIGINYVYTHNYGCEPGTHLSFEELLRAADDEGMLVGFSQPHFGQYDWKAPDADRANGYAAHAAYYARVAGNHPSVVFYAMSHNATGYSEDMNPDLIDGKNDPRESWGRNGARLAQRAEAIVHGIDPGRIVYHHSSGNLGSMHTTNFYPNFTPIQELSDWFEHWATTGVKPVFTCEYGAPFTWDWAMYRGWYKGVRTFGSAAVPWEFCLAEWNAQFLGDRAYHLTDLEKANLRWEARQFQNGRLWHRWDYPVELGSPRFADRHTVIGRYLTDNFRAYRTWGVSAISPWEHGHFWSLRPGVDRRRRELPVDWNNLQRPGISPDFLDQRYERVDLAFDRSDWIPTADGQALLRNNQPLLAYIAGKPSRFTSQDHNVVTGETIEKQIIVINNSRKTVKADCVWSLDIPGRPLGYGGQAIVTVPTGEQRRVPLSIILPSGPAPITRTLNATVRFDTGAVQRDSFAFDVVTPAPVNRATSPRIALFDPKGETAALLARLGFAYRRVDASTKPEAEAILIIGKEALTVEGPGPDLAGVPAGHRVIVFEQTSPVLEKRLGFRVTEHGLRQAFARIPDHPALEAIAAEHLHDWRGEATIVPPRLTYTMRPQYGPTVNWCDIPVTRPWRCGNRGNVASVLIEKPARGDFLPVIDGGFSLQYSPLLEYREGQGLVLFCQLDVTGRTEPDPAADRLAGNLVRYVAAWSPPPRRHLVYTGDPAGRAHLSAAGFDVRDLGDAPLAADDLLVVAPGGGKALAPRAGALATWIASGGRLLALGLDAREANTFLPESIETTADEHISALFTPGALAAPFAGVAPADVHNRDPRQVPLVTGGAGVSRLGDGVLATGSRGRVVFCQVVPWAFDRPGQMNRKRTYRRLAVLVSRLASNAGAAVSTPLLDRFVTPPEPAPARPRWSAGLYLDQPEEWDDPYRFFRW